MKVSIIIISYNTKIFLKNCIQSIYDNAGNISYEIIVVDNNSSDESANMVELYFPKVNLIRNLNEGFAKANNRGINVAIGRYILFLNPDTLMHKNTLVGLFEFMEKTSSAGAATCALIMDGGKLDYSSHRGFPTPWNAFCYFSGLIELFPKNRFFSGYTMGWENMKLIHEIDSLTGAFMFTRREAGMQVGWWDEEYFFNGEDIDFCYKLKEKKWKIYYIPNFSIIHYGGISGGTKKNTQRVTTATRETKRIITLERFNSMRIFYKKHYSQKYHPIINFIVILGINLMQKIALIKI
ncbi:MAG: glycosyltransferase family 2 protein [Candidatus Levybacteria bacterium]|nr:glycosyltransferase family 2 protein [Candidatus Levybacteria bacterium]